MQKVRHQFRFMLVILLAIGCAGVFWAVIIREAVGEVKAICAIDGDTAAMIRESSQGDQLVKIDKNGNVIWRKPLPYDPEQSSLPTYLRSHEAAYKEEKSPDVRVWSKEERELHIGNEVGNEQKGQYLYYSMPERGFFAVFEGQMLKKALKIQKEMTFKPYQFREGKIWIYGVGFWGILDAGTLETLFMSSKEPKIIEVTAEFEAEFIAPDSLEIEKP